MQVDGDDHNSSHLYDCCFFGMTGGGECDAPSPVCDSEEEDYVVPMEGSLYVTTEAFEAHGEAFYEKVLESLDDPDVVWLPADSPLVKTSHPCDETTATVILANWA